MVTFQAKYYFFYFHVGMRNPPPLYSPGYGMAGPNNLKITQIYTDLENLELLDAQCVVYDGRDY